MKVEVKFAVKRRISTRWTMTYVRVGNGAFILHYSRRVAAGYEVELPSLKLTEDRDRTVIAISIDEQAPLVVLNPTFAFDYGSDSLRGSRAIDALMRAEEPNK